MSQASQPGATAVAPAPGSADGCGRSTSRGRRSGRHAGRPTRIRDTPQRLRLLTVGVIVAGLVVGVVGALLRATWPTP